LLRAWLKPGFSGCGRHAGQLPVMHRQLGICLAWRDGPVEAVGAAAVGQIAKACAP
jgi:hypothetical protein